MYCLKANCWKTSRFGFKLLMPFAILLIITLVLNGGFHTCYSASVDQESLDKSIAMRFLEEVICIDLSAYEVNTKWEATPSIITADLYPGHNHTSVNIKLENSDSRFKFDIELIDGKFYYYSLRVKHGTLAKKSDGPANPIELARSILERYSLSFNAAHYDPFNILPQEITQTNSKEEIETDDWILTLFPSNEGGTSFRWCFKMNNIVALNKGLSMKIDEEGLLSWFVDAWRHYKVGSDEVNVPEEKAVNIALGILQTDPEKINVSRESVQLIQRHLNEEGAKIAKYEATLRFDNRRGDCFTLDVAWSVMFYYDKVYSYNIDGFAVYIWADTGQIFDLCPQAWYGDLGQNEAFNPLSHGLVTLILTILLGIPIALTLYKKYK